MEKKFKNFIILRLLKLVCRLQIRLVEIKTKPKIVFKLPNQERFFISVGKQSKLEYNLLKYPMFIEYKCSQTFSEGAFNQLSQPFVPCHLINKIE